MELVALGVHRFERVDTMHSLSVELETMEVLDRKGALQKLVERVVLSPGEAPRVWLQA